MGAAVPVCRSDAPRANVDLPARAVRGARAARRGGCNDAGRGWNRGGNATFGGDDGCDDACGETARECVDQAHGVGRRAVVSEHAVDIGIGSDGEYRPNDNLVGVVEHAGHVAHRGDVEYAAAGRHTSGAGRARQHRRALVYLEVTRAGSHARRGRLTICDSAGPAGLIDHPRRTQITLPSRMPRSRRSSR
ncbi:hypothetical protein EMIT0158MI4_130035 [Burkholderia ambifaria]